MTPEEKRRKELLVKIVKRISRECPIPRTQSVPSKKVYTRKRKHKQDE